MKNPIEDLAHSFYLTRKEKNLSQKELSQLANVPQSHISNIENGKVNIRLSSLFAIARTLGLEPLLIPHRWVPAVKGFLESKKHEDTFQPAFTLDEDDDD